MADLFSTAEEFYKNNPPEREIEPGYATLARDLTFIIESSPFLSVGEKERLKRLLGFMSISMLENLRSELLKEGLTYHHNYQSDKRIARWLKLVTPRLKAVKK